MKQDWLAAVAKLAAVVETGVDRAKYELAERVLPPRALHIAAYRGFGTARELHVIGRVLRNSPLPRSVETATAWENLLATWRRFESDEVPGARVQLRFGRVVQEVTTDDEGFFEATIVPNEPLVLEQVWHEVEAELLAPVTAEGPARATIPVLVPPNTATFLVVSDIDDTVVRTDVTQMVRLARNILFGSARTRMPFPGVAAFYRALVDGKGGSARNPVFYVSSSPWNLHDLLAELFELRGIPLGPILLRDWGISAEELMPTKHAGHKLEAIRKVLDSYPALPAILIGDSGQEDPEIYAQVIREHPGRVLAAYIRHVGADETRAGAIRELAATLAATGGTMLLLDDTVGAARHAAGRGWIDPAKLAGIGADAAVDAEGPPGSDAAKPS